MNRIVVLGAGESGIGAARLAKIKGYQVFVSDKEIIKKDTRSVLKNHEIEWEEGKHTESLILNADEIVKSPGVPDNVPLLIKARKKGIPVISEIEFAYRFTNAKIIAITGSNGKTTTTMLIYHILKNADKTAKYLNSPESEIYHKSKILYGLFQACGSGKDPIRNNSV